MRVVFVNSVELVSALRDKAGKVDDRGVERYLVLAADALDVLHRRVASLQGSVAYRDRRLDEIRRLADVQSLR